MLSFLTAALVLGAAPPGRIDRVPPPLPKLDTASPTFCLLVFGPEARLRLWLVHDNGSFHVHSSADGKWRRVGDRYGTFDLGELRDGKTVYKNIRVSFGHVPRLRAEVDGKQQMAGYDRQGKLALAASAPEAPVVWFDGPLTMDLWRAQQPLRTGQYDELGAVVGTRGIGAGTFAVFGCDAYPPKAWPVAEIEYPAKKGGSPILARVRLADD